MMTLDSLARAREDTKVRRFSIVNFKVPFLTTFMNALTKFSGNSKNLRLFSICPNIIESKAVEKSVDNSVSGWFAILACIVASIS